VSHYDTLEVSRAASPEVIRAAYRSLMQRFHPDRNPGDAAAAARASAIARAYDVLSDAAQRAAYDASLDAVPAALPPAPPTGSRSHRARVAPPPRRANLGWGAWATVAVVVVGAAVAWWPRRESPAAQLGAIRQAFEAPGIDETQRQALLARYAALLAQQPDLERVLDAPRDSDRQARSFRLLEQPLVVHLANDQGAAQLTIPEAVVVAGSFESARLIGHLGRHRERVLQELAAALAREAPGEFAKPDGARRLQRAVVASIAVSLGTDLSQRYPSTFFESPGRYGVVEVLLPAGFQLRSLR
jgi:hypothetical protein